MGPAGRAEMSNFCFGPVTFKLNAQLAGKNFECSYCDSIARLVSLHWGW